MHKKELFFKARQNMREKKSCIRNYRKMMVCTNKSSGCLLREKDIQIFFFYKLSD